MITMTSLYVNFQFIQFFFLLLLKLVVGRYVFSLRKLKKIKNYLYKLEQISDQKNTIFENYYFTPTRKSVFILRK